MKRKAEIGMSPMKGSCLGLESIRNMRLMKRKKERLKERTEREI
jgi:hypothetical protein